VDEWNESLEQRKGKMDHLSPSLSFMRRLNEMDEEVESIRNTKRNEMKKKKKRRRDDPSFLLSGSCHPRLHREGEERNEGEAMESVT